jgi:hypothetical protein
MSTSANAQLYTSLEALPCTKAPVFFPHFALRTDGKDHSAADNDVRDALLELNGFLGIEPVPSVA